ncbi:MAG: di-heme oxidoredictase family protein [Hyphomicrobiaceae bacterium]
MNVAEADGRSAALRLQRVAGAALSGACLLAGLYASASSRVPAAAAVPRDPGRVYAPLATLSSQALARFAIGRAIFAARWVPAPDVSDGADGLGPLYNADSCASCHGGEQERNPVARIAPDSPGSEVFGAQLQDRAVPGVPEEGRLVVRSVDARTIDLKRGHVVVLRRLVPSIEATGYGAPLQDEALSLRRPLAIAGIGLVAAIPEAAIRAGADPDDRDGDGISGRVGAPAHVGTGQAETNPNLARFGWKASVASLAEQAADAFARDLGLSSPLRPGRQADCTPAQKACIAAPDGGSAVKGGYEVSAEEVALVAAFLEGLAPPRPPTGADSETARAGKGVFHAAGCAACHRVAFRTGEVPGKPHLSGVEVALYSDLLLHDLGDGLADAVAEGAASGREWRTAPLWGLGARLGQGGAAASGGEGDGLLHDGRARTLDEAILWHGGEAAAARDRFASMPLDDRAALLAFLSQL